MKRRPPASRSYRAIPEYYDAEYESNDVLDHDVPLLLQHLPKKRQDILELCTGTARAAIPLAQAGHRVVGIDYDPALLAIAKQKRDHVGIPERDLRFVRGDVLQTRLARKFDFVVLLFNTFLNFTTSAQQSKLLQNVHHHLKQGGRFWIDIFYPALSILAEPHHPHFDSATFYVPSLDRSVHRTTEITRSADLPQVQQMTFHYTWADAMGQLHAERSDFDLTWIFPRELELLLTHHGFVIEHLYGDYARRDVTPDSPRIIAMARKR